MYYDRSAQTDVSINPLDDTDGNAEIRGYESTLPLAHPYTSDNHHTVAHSFDSMIPASNREDMDFGLAESHNKRQYQASVEDDVDDFGDLNMYSKSGENRTTPSSGEYPFKSRSSSNGQYLKAHAAKSGSVSSHRQSSTPQSSRRKKIIAPKRPYGSSPAKSQKRSRHTGPAPSIFSNSAMDQDYQSSSVTAQHLMSQPDNSKLPAMGSFAPPSRQEPNKGGLSRAEAMAQVLRNLKREKQSRAHACSPASAPVQENLQNFTLNSTVDDPEQDPFGPQSTYGRPESALSNSRTSVQSTTGAFSGRRGKNRLAPLRSPPPLARYEDQATVEGAQNMHALGNQYSFQTSPGHSYRTLSPSQQSTPAGPMSASPLKFATPTKDQGAYSQKHEPSPLHMMSNFSDYDSAKDGRYECEFAIHNADSPSAGRGFSGGGSRNNPPVPPFNTGSPAVQSTQHSQPAAEKSFMGYDGPAPHTLIPNESIFTKRPATEAPNDEGRPAPKRQAVAKVQLAHNTGSPSPPPVPAILPSNNTGTSYAVQAPPPKSHSIPSDDLFFQPGSPSPPPVAPKKRTSTGSAASDLPKPRKIVPEVALEYDIGAEESKLPALPPDYILTQEPIARTTNRRGSRGSRVTSSARSSVCSPSISSLRVPTKSATPPTGTFKAPSKRSSLASSIGQPEDISRSGTSTPDLNLFATTKPKQKMNSAPAAPVEPEQTMTKAEARREAERKASIAHGVAKIQERTGIP